MKKKKRTLPVYLTASEQRRLIETVETAGVKRDIALIHLMMQYGLRASEVSLLERDDVDYETERIYVARLKGGVDNELPLIEPTRTKFDEYMETREDDDPHAFIGKRGPLTRKGIWCLMQKYGKAANLPKNKRHPHTLRHTAAVNALDAGLDIIEVQDLMGHSAISSTTKYGKVSDKKRRKAFSKIEQANRLEAPVP